MQKHIILDLDGPILDGRLRHYACYRDIIMEMGYEPIGVDRYWKLKREMTDRSQVLKLSNAENDYDRFLQLWLDNIERDEYLALDKLQDGGREKLTGWQETDDLVLILATMRNDRAALIRQLDRLDISGLFDETIACSHQKGGRGKAEAVTQRISKSDPRHMLWIGDTEVDVVAAKTIGCQVWALSCGLRSADRLYALNPDFLTDSLLQVDLSVTSLR